MTHRVQDGQMWNSSANFAVPSYYSHRPSTPWKHRETIVNGIRIHYVEAEPLQHLPCSHKDGMGESCSFPSSSKPALLLLLHGFPDFYYSWRYQITAFVAAGYRVVAPDLRGYNLSEKPATGYNCSYTMNTLVEDIYQLILHLTKESQSTASPSILHDKTSSKASTPDVFVMGHDWGGMIAAATGARYPGLITKIILVEATHLAALENAKLLSQAVPKNRIITLARILEWTPSTIPELILSCNQSWLLISLYFSSSLKPKSSSSLQSLAESIYCLSFKTAPSLEEELYRNAMSQPRAVSCMLAPFRSLGTSSQQVRDYNLLSCPILVIWGECEDDSALAKAHVECLQHICARPVELVIIEKSSDGKSLRQWIHQEKAEEVNRCVIQFLKTRGVMRAKIPKSNDRLKESGP